MLKYVERLLDYQPTQPEVFKFKAFNQTVPLLAEGTCPVVQREKTMAINNLFLPEDVLLEILARLPVKSLLRFRSVSKSWRDIIKEPTFITKHHLTQVAIKDGKCVLVKINCADPRAYGCLAEDEQGGIKFTSWELPFLKDSAKYLEVAGPCNGIFIISDGYDQLFLWNPATREYKALLPSSLMPKPRRRSFSRVGFGIDPISKDYKVVRVWHYGLSDDDDAFIGTVEVMSLSATDSCRPKSEMWKTIDAVPLISLSCYTRIDQIYANGKYYWSNDPLFMDEQYKIVWFDMGAEVFGLIHIPQLRFVSHYHRSLTVVNGSPAVIRPAYKVEENKTLYEIWIIDDYPWTKYATIGPLMNYQKLFGFWNDQEVLVFGITGRDPVTYKYTHQVFSYDIKTNVIKKKMEGLYLDMFYPSVDISGESLISFAE